MPPHTFDYSFLDVPFLSPPTSSSFFSFLFSFPFFSYYIHSQLQLLLLTSLINKQPNSLPPFPLTLPSHSRLILSRVHRVSPSLTSTLYILSSFLFYFFLSHSLFFLATISSSSSHHW
ncbi:hypothetical protein F5H01DRAFT_351495 [Linnemannia elongata]|nr:hypothetical protein F5H01DRAFT_351495 [Linnemannia elongata]